MNSFRRAYRDPKSPLTPLTPLASNTSFTFNLGGDDSLKPFIAAIQQTMGTPESSAGALNNGVKYVNPNKYIKRESTHLSASNGGSESAGKTRKLSSRFDATKKSKMQAKCFVSEPDNDVKCDMPKFVSITNASTSSQRKSMTSNAPYFGETTYSSSSNCYTSACSSTNYNARNETNRSGSFYDSSASNSDFSSDSSTSFATNSSTSSTASASRSNDEPIATISSVLNWVWNSLSPMKNPTIYELLARVDMQKYWKIFEREEILDLDVFSTLTLADLEAIGIRDTEDCMKILKSIGMAINFLSGLFVLKKP